MLHLKLKRRALLCTAIKWIEWMKNNYCTFFKRICTLRWKNTSLVCCIPYAECLINWTKINENLASNFIFDSYKLLCDHRTILKVPKRSAELYSFHSTQRSRSEWLNESLLALMCCCCSKFLPNFQTIMRRPYVDFKMILVRNQTN